MSLVRRRYYFWLARAYLKRWNKAILTSVLFGAVIFFALAAVINFYFLPKIQKKVQHIGYIGIYTLGSIPSEILSDASYGLTRIDAGGRILPAASFKWEIKNGGREYVFHIKHGQYFHNGRELNADNLPLTFKDVEKRVVDKYTVAFRLRASYAPFLTTLAKPIFDHKLSGLGKFKVKDVDINAGFVKSLTLQDTRDAGHRKIITFYPTAEALKTSYALGDVDEARGALDTKIKGTDFSTWPNTSVTKSVNYNTLLTLFYNTEDKILSDKKVRQALSYAVPAKFPEGLRAYSPIRPTSIYFSEPPNYGVSDPEISRNLLSDQKDTKKAVFEITTTDDYLKVAEKVAKAWTEIGIKTKIKVVSELPGTFQILIYPIKLPEDPDQYTLWHSTQINNITKYKNLRIDKLLEDGRSTVDIEKRISLYSDFQKYLIDDAPATFLYFPHVFTIKRK